MDRLYADLCRFDAADWRRAVDTLAAEIHEIDRNATRIWFAFYPLQLHLTLESSTDIAATVRALGWAAAVSATSASETATSAARIPGA